MMLPNGKFTENENEYVKTWKSFVKPLCDATGTQLVGFDPRVSLSDGIDIVQLPLWFIKAFNGKSCGE